MDDEELAQATSGLLGALPTSPLAQITSRSALEGLERLHRRIFKDRTLTAVVGELFPEYSPQRVEEVASRINLNAARSLCWKAIMSIPGKWAVKIDAPDREATAALRALPGPAILPFWHFGPHLMLTIAFRHIGVPVLVISRAEPTLWTNAPDLLSMRIDVAGAGPQQAATALRRSLQHLKKGGKVAIAIDGRLGANLVKVPFLGRQLVVARGAAGLARLTGAPIIPCTMQWTGNGWDMAIRVFDEVPYPDVPPTDTGEFERSILTSIVRRFESYGRQYPGQFWITELGLLINCPTDVGQ